MRQQYIKTEPSSKVDVRLRDGSYFIMGPVSIISVDDFVYAPIEGIGGKALTIYRGNLSYFSGVGAYGSQISLLTPVATLTLQKPAFSAFHLPGLGTVVTLYRGEGLAQGRFGEVNLQTGETIIIGPDGRGVIKPKDIPAALAHEVVKYSLSQVPHVSWTNLPPPTTDMLRQEAIYNKESSISQRAYTPKTPSLVASEWPSNQQQTDAYNVAVRQMPLLVQARRDGLLDQNSDTAKRLERFATKIASQNKVAKPLLETLISQAKSQSAAASDQAHEDLIDGLEADNTNPQDLARIVGAVAAASPEHALDIVQNVLDGTEDMSVEDRSEISSAASRAVPARMNEMVAMTIASLPPDQQADAAKKVVSKLMQNSSRSATAIGGGRGKTLAGPAPLEGLSPDVQKAIADELKKRGFQQGGQSPDIANQDTPSAQTRLAERQTPKPGSKGGLLDIITFLSSTNFLVFLIIIVIIIITIFVFYRVNALERIAMRQRRIRQLEIRRRQMEKQAELSREVEKIIGSSTDP